VAAPTAGLHFTKKLVENLLNKSISLTRVTLHVGIGTFRPVSVEKLSDHEMHSEWGRVDQVAVDEITKCKQRGGRVIAVGTTSVRVLETAARRETLTQWEGLTDLFIRPGFEFRCIDGLMTNFHLPKSTLLVLVRTFGGDELMRRAYAEAIAEKYRFFSYGDAMLIV
jgi:S-adenosylmethionine:tRNA ribosyltransferase-isomerase